MSRWLVLWLACAGCGDPAPGGAAPPGDGDGGGGGACDGPCRDTALTAAFASARVLDRAVFGIDARDATLHVEAYRGGATGCPSESSPTPDYTLVLGQVPDPAAAPAATATGNLLDFVGDLLGGDLGTAATSVVVLPVAAALDAFVALDVELGFPGGTVTGHLYATRCASLDRP